MLVDGDLHQVGLRELEQDDDQVKVLLHFKDLAEEEISCDWLVGADGAGSHVASAATAARNRIAAANVTGSDGFTPTSIHTTAKVHLESGTGGSDPVDERFGSAHVRRDVHAAPRRDRPGAHFAAPEPLDLEVRIADVRWIDVIAFRPRGSPQPASARGTHDDVAARGQRRGQRRGGERAELRRTIHTESGGEARSIRAPDRSLGERAGALFARNAYNTDLRMLTEEK